MTRTLLRDEDITVLSPIPAPDERGTWLIHERCRIEGLEFPAEVVRRRNKQYVSHKAVPLFVSERDARRVRSFGYCTNREFFRDVARVGKDRCSVLLLHALRPVYFFPWPDDEAEYGLTENWQLELPGGQVKGKQGAAVALGELIQEAGIGAKDILSWTESYPSPSANDAGTHVERYGMWYVLCTGEPRPPRSPQDPSKYKEGIVGFDTVPATELGSFLREAASQGIPIELFVHLAASGLCAEMLGGWDALKTKEWWLF